jgi:hypothetical protein
MIEKFRKFLEGTAGKVVGVAIFLAAVGLLVFSGRDMFGETQFAEEARNRVFVCSETGKSFRYTIEIGTGVPVPSPHSGKNTGYPAEFCYWTKDGKVKQEPTPVLLNSLVGKKGATFCPDCERLVVAFNPTPMDGMQPPPKKSDMKSDAAEAMTGDGNRGE